MWKKGTVVVLLGALLAAPSRAQDRPTVRIGFDTIEGEPRYADRAQSSDGSVTVRFSTTRTSSTRSDIAIPTRLPVSGARLTSNYGYRIHPITGRGTSHAGVDLAVASGTPVVATSDGQVSVAGWSGNYGILVAVEHEGGVQTRYGHLSALSVRPGDTVAKGQVIGLSGATGRTTGPHIHYEVRVDGYAVNPMP